MCFYLSKFSITNGFQYQPKLTGDPETFMVKDKQVSNNMMINLMAKLFLLLVIYKKTGKRYIRATF